MLFCMFDHNPKTPWMICLKILIRKVGNTMKMFFAWLIVLNWVIWLLNSENSRRCWVSKLANMYILIICNYLLYDYTILRNIQKEGFNCIKNDAPCNGYSLLTPHTWKKNENRDINIHREQSYSYTM